MTNLYLALFGIGLFSLSILFVRAFYGYAERQNLIDVPNERSSHERPVPRGAGIAFILLWILTTYLFFKLGLISFTAVTVFLPGALLIAVVGFWDDVQGLSAKQRLAIQVVAAIFCVGMLGGLPSIHLFDKEAIEISGAGLALAILLLVWSTNAYNFMDGLDGLAAVEALFVFGVGGFLFWGIGQVGIALLSWALVLSVSGFLVWNWPKARVFMGDAGSCCLGFLVAAFALVGERFYHLPILLWVMLYSVFWFDATLTIIRRLLKRENLTTAHCKHAYQRLHKAGFSHKQVLLCVSMMNAIIASIVVWTSLNLEYLKVGFFSILVFLAAAYLMIEIMNPMWGKHAKT